MDLSSFNIPASEDQPIQAIIARRRRQILVHSVIYYVLDDELVTDATFDRWCRELVALQDAYPDDAAQAPLAEEFHGFTGSSGFDLPLTDPHYVHLAQALLRHRPEIA